MPATYFRITWPDGAGQRCFSPSLVVRDFLEPGTSYPLAEFVHRASRALEIGSERVRERYGSGCPSAAAQRALIDRRAREWAESEGAEVLVERFES